jgi:hypothetical protein
VAQLRHEIEAIRAYGAELVVIGNGTLHLAAAFRDDLQLDTPLFVDNSRASYRALGMRRGIPRTLGTWKVWGGLGRALLAGIREKRLGTILRWWRQSIPGARSRAVWRRVALGGVLIVLRDRRVPNYYVSATNGDHPLPSEILSALAKQAR